MSPQPPPAGQAPALDPQALARLRQLDPDGRQGVLGRVLRAYENSLLSTMQQIQAMRPLRDLDGIRELAHKLKSSSAAVGAMAMAARCADVESRLRDGAPFDAVADVENLLAEAARALQAVRAMLPPDSPS